MTIIQSFFSELNQVGVMYVHFKSNTELDVSFDGKGDFDVLVSEDDFERMESILAQFKAKKFETIREKRYPYVCSWLIYDEVSGKIYHIHLHRRIVTGKEFVKDYIIPWHSLLLDTRVLNQAWNIYITEPNLELILLAARTVVKSKAYDRKNAKQGSYQLHKDLDKERRELQEEFNLAKLKLYCETLFPGENYAPIIDFCQNSEVDSALFLRLSTFFRQKLVKGRRMWPLSAEIQSRIHSFSYRVKCHVKRKYGADVITKKVLENRRGLIIALVGVDGSGKSTTVKKLQRWLEPQIDSKRYYLGEGEGKTGIVVVALKKMLGIYTDSGAASPKNVAEKTPAKSKTKKLTLKRKAGIILRTLIVVLVQRRNLKLVRKMDHYRRKGGISFTDRYPQIEIPRVNDGLKVEKYLELHPSSFILKGLQKMEKTYMEKIVRIKPDVVFRLNISAQTSMERKPEQQDITVYQEKISTLQSITFNNSYLVDVNAEEPYEKELLFLKSRIWELMRGEVDNGIEV